MSVLLIVGIVWGLSALVRASQEAKRQREAERQRAEQAKRSAELARMTAEWKQRQAEAKAETARLIALEREQMRITREQERQAKEQARQAEQLARHEEQLARLEQQVSLAEREIAHYQPIVDELRREAEGLAFKVSYFEGRGLPCAGYKTQLERVNEKLYRMETKVIKAENTKQNAQRKLSA